MVQPSCTRRHFNRCSPVCQIWKDVDGFFTADPRIVRNARCLDEVSYEEAMELTYYGANVISAKALMPLAANQIPCQVRNTYNPSKPGTLVHGKAVRAETVRGISHLHDVSTITLQGGFLRGRVGDAVAKMANFYYQKKDYARAIDSVRAAAGELSRFFATVYEG